MKNVYKSPFLDYDYLFIYLFADKARDFIGKWHPGGEQQGKGTQENSSASWLAVSSFMVIGLVSRWSLAKGILESAMATQAIYMVSRLLFGKCVLQRKVNSKESLKEDPQLVMHKAGPS